MSKVKKQEGLRIFISVPNFSFDPEADREILTLSAIARAALKDNKDLKIIPFQSQPGLFLTEPAVVGAIEARGDDALPITMQGDKIILSGRAPSREELSEWLGTGPIEVDLWREAMIQKELASIKSDQCGVGCSSQGGCVSCSACSGAFLASEQEIDPIGGN